MSVGDKWQLTCPANLAFGNKGRPPSPGRPRYVWSFFLLSFLYTGIPGMCLHLSEDVEGFARSSRHAFRPLLSILQQSRNRGELYTCFRAF